ncbi:hypothetical protein CYMTET_51698 [Cymbomonas tetramitiformis]|uniref:Uncharacterized protein n=1 Tax=Cymbomonas tetramitiformis TaxID=36881 RepID=A0AAE0BLQ3_9CHLO|nr:hypothetical protein CYMTET_51698 [Cymbomonas tetramitiformis]
MIATMQGLQEIVQVGARRSNNGGVSMLDTDYMRACVDVGCIDMDDDADCRDDDPAELDQHVERMNIQERQSDVPVSLKLVCEHPRIIGQCTTDSEF